MVHHATISEKAKKLQTSDLTVAKIKYFAKD